MRLKRSSFNEGESKGVSWGRRGAYGRARKCSLILRQGKEANVFIGYCCANLRSRQNFVRRDELQEHCIEQDVPIPEEPTLFSKFNNTVTKYNGDVVFDSRLTQEMDWEVEMVIVIGKEGKNIKKENAMDYVAGYSVSHDVSARDWQMKKNGGQWLLGKSMDTFFPYGPYIVTKDEQIDPHNLGIRCYVNDKLVQNSNTNELVFKTEELVEYISKFVTLLPGDLISTGTPSGVGCFRNPPVFLKHGDRVRCEIDHLGVVENNMVDIGRSSL